MPQSRLFGCRRQQLGREREKCAIFWLDCRTEQRTYVALHTETLEFVRRIGIKREMNCLVRRRFTRVVVLN